MFPQALTPSGARWSKGGQLQRLSALQRKRRRREAVSAKSPLSGSGHCLSRSASHVRSARGGGGHFRLVKRELPRPVPMVKTPQWSTSCMFALAQTLDHGIVVDHEKWFVTVDQRQSAGELGRQAEVVLLPVARQVLCPLLDGTVAGNQAGTTHRDERREPQLLFLCGLTGSSIMAAMWATASSRVGSSSLWCHREDFQMPALVMSPFLILSSTMPTRRLAPPISAAMMASGPSRIHDGASWRSSVAAPARSTCRRGATGRLTRQSRTQRSDCLFKPEQAAAKRRAASSSPPSSSS